MRIHLALLLLVLAAPAIAAPPTFSRITDANNPVVNDMLESGGGCWTDLDDDGRLDLFVAHGNLTNQDDRLYHNAGGFQFVRVTTGPVVSSGGSSIGGTWGDYDNDGHPDLFVTNRSSFGNFLYHGVADTLFDRILTGAVVTDLANSNSSSWVDVDGDGDLDLYVVNFQGDDFLYVNGGAPDFAFTRALGHAITVGTEFSIAGIWADYNDDNRPDLFVGNAGTQNDYLWTNQGGLDFVKTTIADGRSSLGASWGDYDNDGDLDLFVANNPNQASLLYRNAGPPTYALVPVAAGAMTTELANSVGSTWGDADNDGDLDLFVARDGQAQALFLNDGPPAYSFTKVLAGDEVTTVTNGFGCSMVDVDQDGQLDLFVANRTNQSDLLYRNDGNANHWLGVHCRGTTSNRSAIGARVRVRATIGGVPRWMTQEVAGQSGYNSQVLDLHFGLGDATSADSVVVRWPSGIVEGSSGVQADDRVTLVEGLGVVGVPRLPGNAGGLSLRLVPANSSITLRFTLPRAGRATLRLYDVAGRLVRTIEDGVLDAGAHALQVERASLPARGLYFCRLEQGGDAVVAKLVQGGR
jgi:hypothetical protein